MLLKSRVLLENKYVTVAIMKPLPAGRHSQSHSRAALSPSTQAMTIVFKCYFCSRDAFILRCPMFISFYTDIVWYERLFLYFALHCNALHSYAVCSMHFICRFQLNYYFCVFSGVYIVVRNVWTLFIQMMCRCYCYEHRRTWIQNKFNHHQTWLFFYSKKNIKRNNGTSAENENEN